MKKVWGLLLAIGLAAWQAECYADAPGVRFIPPGPGNHAPLDTNGEGAGYGWKQLQTGNWTFDGDSATIDNTIGAVLRYWTSSLGNTVAGPATAMSDTEDWVFELFYKHTGNYTGEWPWYVKAETADERIVQLRHIGGSTNDSWQLGAGLVDGGWAAIGDPFSLGSDFNKFTVHYKAATQTLDAYRNDVLIPGAVNFALEHGNYKRRLRAARMAAAGCGFLPEPQARPAGSGADDSRPVRLGDCGFGRDDSPTTSVTACRGPVPCAESAGSSC